MQVAVLFGTLICCTCYISVKSSTNVEKNTITKPNDETFKVFVEKGLETDKTDMLRSKKNKGGRTARNCLDLKKRGKSSGTYKINPCDYMPSKAINVYCDMDTDGGGWTVIQRRDNYPEQENFYRTWLEYLLGFGDVTKDFWLGNENIHCLTKQSYNEIRFELVDWTNSSRYAKYGFFYVHDEATKFKLVARGYSGTAGDSLAQHNGQYFSTFDGDNDRASGNCAETYTGAWWYNVCHNVNLNGIYNSTKHASGVTWYAFKGHNYSLKKAEIKIRPRNN